MANSLMELYGGGMVGKSNNYQLGGRIPKYPLGGRIASSRRGRDFQGEMRELRKKQEAANRRKKKSGFLGSIGSLAGGALGAALAPVTGGLSLALATGLGAGLGRAAGESSYAREDYSGGKYAQDTRGSLRDAEDDYRAGIGERALVTGLQAAIMPGVYDKVGQVAGQGVSFVKGLPEALEAAGEMAQAPGGGFSEYLNTLGDYAKSFSPSSELAGASFNPMATAGAMTTGPTQAIQDLGLAENIDYGMARDAYAEMYPDQLEAVNPNFNINDFYETLNLPGQGFNRQGGMIPKMPMGGEVSEENLIPTPPIPPKPLPVPMSGTASGNQRNKYGVNLGALQGLTNSGWNIGNVTGSILGDGSGVDIGLQGQMDSLTAPPQGQASGQYGTAIGATSALNQMGMGDVANDPRLQEYLEDLPQFSQGYQQQFGDIQSGGRQALSQMYANQRNMGGGFAGAGAGAQAFGQQYGGLMGEQARKRRGVVEGFQSDLLSAIGDIEAKGEFEFGEKGLQDRQKKIDFIKQRFPNLSDDKIAQMVDAAG